MSDPLAETLSREMEGPFRDFCCSDPACGHRFGLTSNKRLLLGTATVIRRTHLVCPKCFRGVTWRPAEKT